ncbi:hypothetical protein BCR43DRAFT_497511 [Syncephalastrum racemosum]|uniref:Fructose-bisphosphate aldolase n=1 Tax=Syncephalastrum racemosum TaxID=13706 RepID=A0A1X2H2B5_SYNRA|nr:hypothetical protein BCR43DRAFT_497511 [Syncephalastrum racemosum]
MNVDDGDLEDPSKQNKKTEFPCILLEQEFFLLLHLISYLSSTMGILDLVPPGVITGDDVLRVMQYAEDNNFAIPSINVTSTR